MTERLDRAIRRAITLMRKKDVAWRLQGEMAMSIATNKTWKELRAAWEAYVPTPQAPPPPQPKPRPVKATVKKKKVVKTPQPTTGPVWERESA